MIPVTRPRGHGQKSELVGECGGGRSGRTHSVGALRHVSTWDASVPQREPLSRDGAVNSGDQLCVREIWPGKRTPQVSAPRRAARVG